MFTRIFAGACVVASAISTSAMAKDWQVEMLNFGEQGPMVFEPAYIHAEVGDTVTFVPTQPGHYSQSDHVPEGQEAWQSKLNQPYTVELTEQGVTLYHCPPHLVMGMVGVIQVGEANNLVEFKEAYEALRERISLNPERVDAIVEQVQ
ncbi:pseudoazurin [Marinomonas ostreistagni]|nr:pseudoazurin [Marinomonas ostreistagni]